MGRAVCSRCTHLLVRTLAFWMHVLYTTPGKQLRQTSSTGRNAITDQQGRPAFEPFVLALEASGSSLFSIQLCRQQSTPTKQYLG